MRLIPMILVLAVTMYILAYTAMKLDQFNHDITRAMVTSYGK